MKSLYEAVGIVWEKKAPEADPEVLKIYAEGGFEKDYLEGLEPSKVDDFKQKFLVEEDLKRLRREFFAGKPEGFSVDAEREFLRLWGILEMAGRHFFAVCPDFPRVAKMEDFKPGEWVFDLGGNEMVFVGWEWGQGQWMGVTRVGYEETRWPVEVWRFFRNKTTLAETWKKEIEILKEFVEWPEGLRPIDYEWREWIESVIDKAVMEIEKMAALVVWDE